MNFEINNERFVDSGNYLHEIADEFLVICPNCSEQAIVLFDGKTEFNPSRHLFEPRKLVCRFCGHNDSWKKKTVFAGKNTDWYFCLPLWLQISCCGNNLWAYNYRHLELLESYAHAKLRERTKKGRNSFFSKLPQWITRAKNRDEILKAVGRLKEKLNGKT